MRVLAKVQLLYTLNAQAQQLEMFWDLKISRQLLNKAVAGLPWTSMSWPSPERSTSRTELLPMPLTLSNRLPSSGSPAAPQPKLLLGLGHQPTDLHGGLLVELGRLGTAGIGEEIQLIGPTPTSKHQGSDPRGAIKGHCRQLQPTGRWGTPFALLSRTNQRPPRWQGHSHGYTR